MKYLSKYLKNWFLYIYIDWQSIYNKGQLAPFFMPYDKNGKYYRKPVYKIEKIKIIKTIDRPITNMLHKNISILLSFFSSLTL